MEVDMQQEMFKRGFKETHFKTLLTYCKMTKKDPRITYTKFHKTVHPYSRTQTTIDLINAAYKKEVITGPVLYANVGIDVSFLKDIDDPLGLLEKCENDGETTLAFALRGDWSFIRFKYGASMLEFTDAILPYAYTNSNCYIEDIFFHEKGKLPRDPYPHGWSDEHWEIYRLMGSPRDVHLRDIGNQLGLSWVTVKKYYTEVRNQCKVLSCFFPLGKSGYSHQVITFKTDYEIGIYKALRKLNRTTFLYKANGIIILILCLVPRPGDFNISTNKFSELEEEGIIHDLHVSTPRKWLQDF